MIRPTQTAKILEFKSVVKEYRWGNQTKSALGPISLGADVGEFIAVMGPSGSGKTTLLRIAGTLDSPTRGEVFLDGQNLDCRGRVFRAALRRKKLGFVFQEFNLLPGLNVVENVALPLELDGHPQHECRRQASDELEKVGLAHLAKRFPGDLSGGEQQRVAIARALVGPRRVLLADEPTGALDSVTGEQIMQILRDQSHQGRTIILVTHNASHAAWADRVLYLRDGLVVDEVRAVAHQERAYNTAKEHPC